MRLTLPHLLRPTVVFFLGGCQIIADLTIPTYSGATSTAGAGGAGTGGATTSTATTGSGGALVTGQGGACTVSADPTIPPCLEHLQLWLVGDREDLVTKDGQGVVTEWRDASSFGWTATAPAGTVTWVEKANGQHAVHIAHGGMKLDPHARALALDEVGVFGAFNAATFPPPAGDDQAHFPFGASDLLCLRTSYAAASLEASATTGQGTLGTRFSMVVSDGSQSNRMNVQNKGLSLDMWGIYGAGYACDASCASGMMNVQRFGFADGDSYIPDDPVVVSLDPGAFPSWNGAWDRATVGSFCDDPSKGQIDADVGELLLYDVFFDEAMRGKVQQYLVKRWVH